jgi:hypothetical protein
MAGEASKSATARTGILVLALIGIFYGMYMLGQAVAAESEATQAKLDGLILQMETLSREVRSLKPRRMPRRLAPPHAPPRRTAPGDAPAPGVGEAAVPDDEPHKTRKDAQEAGTH